VTLTFASLLKKDHLNDYQPSMMRLRECCHFNPSTR
jgi:hypothetical protein